MNCNSSSATIYEEAEGSWARPCDGCYTVPSVVYCPADSAYLCTSCDVRVHTANCVASRHERVCLSEAYEHAPAPVECRTDAAASRAAYEAQVHYANLLAGMHQCVPVVSHPPTAIPAAPLLAEAADTTAILGCKEEEASWLLLSKNSASHYCSGSSSSSAYFAEVDEYFDLTGYNSYYNSHMNNNNRVQYVMQEQQHLQQMQKEYAEKEGSECLVPSQSATISFQSMEAGIVPDNTVLDHMAHSSILTPAGARGQLSGPPLHLSSMEREARVLRYREKKKTRSFQKTTRYATRKLYAEARPRIKGRFVKRSEAEIEVDQMFSDGPLYDDTSYSSVPWL